MNREIKFRAWHKPTKTLFPVYSITPDFIAEDCYDGIFTKPTTMAERSDCELMQFIGLKDWNGKEIYEGDKVHGIQSGVIVFQKEMASFGLSTDGSGNIETMYWFHGDISSDDIEVIGNIYEPDFSEQKV